jgi:hypothetical protein
MSRSCAARSRFRRARSSAASRSAIARAGFGNDSGRPQDSVDHLLASTAHTPATAGIKLIEPGNR